MAIVVEVVVVGNSSSSSSSSSRIAMVVVWQYHGTYTLSQKQILQYKHSASQVRTPCTTVVPLV